MISGKQTQRMHMKQNVFLKIIEQQLQNPVLRKRTSNFQTKIKLEICSKLPKAFWKKKQQMVNLPYDKCFNKKQIPIKLDLSRWMLS